MKKAYFWPAAMVTMGLVILAQNLHMLPVGFENFWPLVLIVVGLGGLLTADREEWLHEPKKTSSTKSKAQTKTKKKTK